MIESEVIVTTKHGRMPTFMAAPDREGPHPGIIFYASSLSAVGGNDRSCLSTDVFRFG
jgi:hypothetical protein